MLATMRYAVLLAVCACLLATTVGCATVEPTVVKVPVPVVPVITVPARPELAISQLPPKPTAIQVQEAYVKSLSICVDYTNTLDDLLTPYKAKNSAE